MSSKESTSPGKEPSHDESIESDEEDEFHDARFPPEEEAVKLHHHMRLYIPPHSANTNLSL
jgi:hypothetical protein